MDTTAEDETLLPTVIEPLAAVDIIETGPVVELTTPAVAISPFALIMSTPETVNPPAAMFSPAFDSAMVPAKMLPDTVAVEPALKVSVVAALELIETAVLVSVSDTDPPEAIFKVPALVVSPLIFAEPPLRSKVFADNVP